MRNKYLGHFYLTIPRSHPISSHPAFPPHLIPSPAVPPHLIPPRCPTPSHPIPLPTPSHRSHPASHPIPDPRSQLSHPTSPSHKVWPIHAHDFINVTSNLRFRDWHVALARFVARPVRLTPLLPVVSPSPTPPLYPPLSLAALTPLLPLSRHPIPISLS